MEARREARNRQEENENTNEGPTFDWEELPEELPVDLQKLYVRFTGPTGKKFDIHFLEGVSTFTVLPLRAPENNHRGDARNGQDKIMRATQQEILHCLRV